MGTEFLQAIGGLGMFLLGMVVMTDGLKMLTGEALQRALARFTRSPTSGAVTGAATTAIIQSSSATSVAAIGFVNAGLLTFPQALGILFGANIGTTITGWLVALVGFKLDLGTLVMPLALVGVLVYMFAKGRARHAGIALAGFTLIFVGIEMMQGGMAGLEGTVTPETFPADTWGGRLLLIGIGMLITLVTQSSSAGVATAITAVNVGAISFPQAAAMVIGFDVGTTFTALIAVIGGSVPARRTGFSHVIYNFMTGTGAYFLLTLYVWALVYLLPDVIQTDPELALVGFHTLFNSLGVILVLPFANAFANMIIRLVPERGPMLTRHLNETLVPQPSIAMQAVDRTLHEIIEQVIGILRRLLVDTEGLQAPPTELDSVNKALRELHIYLDKLVTSSKQANVHRQHVSALHIRDHLARIVRRCQAIDIIETIHSDEELLEIARRVVETVDRLQTSLVQSRIPIPIDEIKRTWSEAEERAEPYRAGIFTRFANDEITREEANARLSGIRWMRRISLHLWRITHHMNVLSKSDLTKVIQQKEA
jgi:phosphate:Na+ symporter